MASELPAFSPDQWNFLAVLEALESPVPIEIIGTLVPLTPVPLFDLIQRATELCILEKTDRGVFALTSKFSSQILAKLQAINSPKRIAEVMDQLTSQRLLDRIDQRIILKLLLKAQREEEACRIELALAEKAIINQEVETAIEFMEHLIEGNCPRTKISVNDKQLFPMVLRASELCIANGKRFSEILTILQKALPIAEAQGDRRSQALIDMHIGAILHLSGRYIESFEALSAGKEIVEELGDNDILDQTSHYVGLYYFIQGRYQKSIPYFETAVEKTRLEADDFINPFAPVFLSLAVLPFHQIDRAFTILDIFHQKAEQKKQAGAATILRTVLGFILLRLKKEKEALTHLAIAHNKAGELENVLALFWVNLFIASQQFFVGNIKEAMNIFMNAMDNAARVDLGRPYAPFPWVLDMLLEFERQDLEQIPECCKLDVVTKDIMKGPNAPLKGILLRLLGKRIAIKKGPVDQIQPYLEESMKYLEHTGFGVEVAKTRIALAKLELCKGNLNKAQEYAQEGWRDLPVYAEHFFPDDLKYLIENVTKGPFLKSFSSPEVIFNRFSDILEGVVPTSDLTVLLRRIVTATNWFFSAERGGFFLFEGDLRKIKPHLMGAVNLTEIETASKNFQNCIKLMKEAIQKDRPLINKMPFVGDKGSLSEMFAILCLPIHLGEDRHCVLYHDNSVLLNCFDFLDDHTLGLFKTYLNGICRRIWEYYPSTQRRKILISEEIVNQENTLQQIMIGQSPIFLDVLKKAGRIAGTDYHVLIQGETGVGKDIMARWVKNNSSRRDGPFVIIDSTTIPENLMESEFFGHEKGAFTGAERVKPGRVELADGGTLFLDEVGELPLSIQAKLLRVLEEKTFTRVGGSRVHKCDFRLIAATNRNLAKEVQAGRFREDLFYRLNVLCLHVPPLRERKEDIILLAQHFLELSCKWLKRPMPPLTFADISALRNYPWPGNIRELKNLIERAALLSNDNHLELQLVVTTADQQSCSFEDMPSIFELERRYIAHVLEVTGGRIGGAGGAADVLGLKRTSLYSRMKKLGMSLGNEDVDSANRERLFGST